MSRKTHLVALGVALVGILAAHARAVVLMEDDIDVSFSFSNNFASADADHPMDDGPPWTEGTDNMPFSGSLSLEENHPAPKNVWGGSALIFEENLEGPGDASAAERDLSQFDDRGKVKLSWWYKVMEPMDEGVLPVTEVSLRFLDTDSINPDDGTTFPENKDITSVGSYDMIADGAWHQATVILDVLPPAERAALDDNTDDNPDVTTVWKMTTDIGVLQAGPPDDPDNKPGAPSHFFIDLVEMNPVPEPSAVGLVVLSLWAMAMIRRRR